MVSRLSASLLEGLHLRFELFALELGEERERIVEMLVASLVLVFAVFMLLLCVNAALLILWWDTHRLAVVGGSTAFYTLLLLGCVLLLRRRGRNHPEPFATTRRVLDQDREELRGLR